MALLKKGRLIHCGLLLVLVGAVLRWGWGQEGFLELRQGQAVSGFWVEDDLFVPLDFSLRLKKIGAEFYDAKKTIPKDYRADIQIVKDGKVETEAVARVNHPLKFAGCWFYQYGYDPVFPDQTLIQAVKDPGLGWVYAGYALLLLGLAVFGRRIISLDLSRNKIIYSLVFVALFCLAAMLIFSRRHRFLVPALQSHWLIWHILSCMSAYSLFALLFILSFKRRISSSGFYLRQNFLYAGMFLLILGIIMGSVWGKYAWGNWWNWDPKETWALITVCIYAAYFHPRLWPGLSRERRLRWVARLGFLSCIFTYFGVNFLLKGMHSYG
ncbi:MAG: cytochrome c biogenesis protein CcsA [Candidatus Omnitrophota bacterium]